MTQKAPGKSYRKGLSLIELNRMFPDDAAAERWYTQIRWPHGAFCPYCGSFDVQCNIKHKTMTHRCRDCPTRPFFSLKTGSVMQGSKLGYQVWAIATYLITTNIKGVSSMKLHRDVKVTQKTAWHLAHRLREGLKNNTGFFFGPVEVDETFIGGKEGNKHESKKLKAGRGDCRQGTPVAGVLRTGRRARLSAEVVEGTDRRPDAAGLSWHEQHGAMRLPWCSLTKHAVPTIRLTPATRRPSAHSSRRVCSRDMAHT